jgi:anti-anti-sigma regulatory factor
LRPTWEAGPAGSVIFTFCSRIMGRKTLLEGVVMVEDSPRSVRSLGRRDEVKGLWMVRIELDEQAQGGGTDVVLVGCGSFGAGALSAMKAALESMPEARALVVDLAEVDFLGERGLSALLGTAYRLYAEGRMMVIRGANEPTRVLLRSVGLHRWAAVEQSSASSRPRTPRMRLTTTTRVA